MATLKTTNTTGKYHDPNSIPDVIALGVDFKAIKLFTQMPATGS